MLIELDLIVPMEKTFRLTKNGEDVSIQGGWLEHKKKVSKKEVTLKRKSIFETAVKIIVTVAVIITLILGWLNYCLLSSNKEVEEENMRLNIRIQSLEQETIMLHEKSTNMDTLKSK